MFRQKGKGTFFYSAVSSHRDHSTLTDLFTQTPFRLLLEASSHMLQLMREGCSYTYPPLSIVKYSFIQLGELEHCRVNKLAQGFNTAAQDSNPGPLSRESETLPLSHCALQNNYMTYVICHGKTSPDNVVRNCDILFATFVVSRTV